VGREREREKQRDRDRQTEIVIEGGKEGENGGVGLQGLAPQ
jgi:hypothetical protein